MKYAVEKGSGAIMYISSFIKTVSGIGKQKAVGKNQTYEQHCDVIILLLVFKIRKVGYKHRHYRF
jgi:hypothetical protein